MESDVLQLICISWRLIISETGHLHALKWVKWNEMEYITDKKKFPPLTHKLKEQKATSES